MALSLVKCVDYHCRAEFIRPTAKSPLSKFMKTLKARSALTFNTNLLRADLVRDIDDYPRWDCIWMTGRDEMPMVE